MQREYTKNDFAFVSFDTKDTKDPRKLRMNPKTTPPNIITLNPDVFVVFKGKYYMRTDAPSEPITADGLAAEIRKLNRAFEAAKPARITGDLLREGNVAGYNPDGSAQRWEYQDRD